MPEFEALIDRIYEASALPEQWPSVLQDLAATVDAAGAMLLTSRSRLWAGWRISPGIAQGADAFLRSEGARRSITTERLFSFGRAGFVADHELFAEEEYLQDSMVTEWALPMGFFHGAATGITPPGGDLAVVQVQRRTGQQRFDRGELDRLDAFRPHLARAAMLATRWRMERLRAATEALALIGLPAAVLESDGRVVAANYLIEEAKDHVSWGAHDRLHLFDRNAGRQLMEHAAVLATDAVGTGCSLPISGRNDAAPMVAHLIPTAGQSRDLFYGASAFLVLTPVKAAGLPDVSIVQALFDLTATEAKVALSLSAGHSLESIAAGHKVSLNTVRTQVKAILAKTGSRRQVELVAKLRPLHALPPATLAAD